MVDLACDGGQRQEQDKEQQREERHCSPELASTVRPVSSILRESLGRLLQLVRIASSSSWLQFLACSR
jgi:hypothetical protein